MKRITTRKRSNAHTRRVVADARRHALRAMGVDAWKVAATPDNELYELMQQHLTLELVTDVEPVTASEGRTHWYPRMIDEGHTADEVASLLTYTTGRFVEVSEVTGITPWGGDVA